ncbi:MAG: TPM domain-containing protein, partial [Prochlorococcaceae cyanobacterium]
LWVMLFVVFGLGPVVTRTSDLLPVLRNALGFLGGAVAAYLIAQKTMGPPAVREGSSSGD